MVAARLHLICGNCGNGDAESFDWEHSPADVHGDASETVYLCCKNCLTIHDLNDNASKREKKGGKGFRPIEGESFSDYHVRRLAAKKAREAQEGKA